MHVLRKHISGIAAWALIPAVLWSALPSSVCVCADGKLMLFCSLHGPEAGHETRGASPCCKASRENQKVGCPDESQRAERQWTSKSCSRVTNTRSVATVSAWSKVRADAGLSLSVHPADLSCHKPVAVVAVNSQSSTGPPRDIVISLHCLLI
jgi:hypothetical protein